MKLSTAAATILFLEAWSSNNNLAFGKFQVYLGNVTKQSEGCDWSEKIVGKGAIVEVTGCTGTFKMSDALGVSGAHTLGKIHIPADSGVDSVEINSLTSGAKLIAPGVTKVTVTNEAADSCIQLAEEGQVVGKNYLTGEEVQVEEGYVVNEGGTVVPGSGLTIGNAACPDYDKNDFEPAYSAFLFSLLPSNIEYHGTEFCSFPKGSTGFLGANVTVMDCTEFDLEKVGAEAILNLKSPLKKVTIGSVQSGTVNFEGSNLEEVSIDTVKDFGNVNIEGSSLQTVKFDKVYDQGKVNIESSSLKTLTFQSIFNRGEVKACSTDGLKVEGDSVNNEGIIHTGPNTEFTVGEVTRLGQARKFADKDACLSGKGGSSNNNGGSSNNNGGSSNNNGGSSNNNGGSSNNNLAFGKFQAYLGDVTKQSEGCDWSKKYVGKGAIVEVTGCTGTFKMGSATTLGEIRIPADSGVDSVEIFSLNTGAKLIAPGVTKVTVTNDAADSCIQLAEEGQVVGKNSITGEEVQVEEGSFVVFLIVGGIVVPGSGLTIGNAACPDYNKNDFEPGYSASFSSLFPFNVEYHGTEFCSFPKGSTGLGGTNVTVMDCTEFDWGSVGPQATTLNLKSPLKKVTIGGPVTGTVNFEGSNLEEVKIDTVEDFGNVNIEGSSLKTLTFKKVSDGGAVKACSTDGLKVEGDSVVDGGIIHTGPNTEFTVGEVTRGGQARKFADKDACLSGKGGSAAATTSTFGILMATTVAVVTALFV